MTAPCTRAGLRALARRVLSRGPSLLYAGPDGSAVLARSARSTDAWDVALLTRHGHTLGCRADEERELVAAYRATGALAGVLVRKGPKGRPQLRLYVRGGDQ